MNDLVERLRRLEQLERPGWSLLGKEAADEIERLRAQANAGRDRRKHVDSRPPFVYTSVDMDNLLVQELNKLVGEQKDALAARKAEIDRLRAEIDRLRELKLPASRELLNITKASLENAEAEIRGGSQRAFELAVLRALARLLWECGDGAGHEALQQLIRRKEG